MKSFREWMKGLDELMMLHIMLATEASCEYKNSFRVKGFKV